ncbi:palmitoyltransferase ZDHHC15B-like isoform X2 [Anneissia japonica]|uniref:palmitoyltransferase ZDHHC15B-like isoform X2 n=1 Tax=Anneissia japonica TaxID=1529436 RepID=UPI0014259284|nr:palmitoyltransferase ZDHHC15B-like isoform X2 [Anneissia japonica]
MGAIKTCLKAASWFPVIFISLIVGWSYYAYVVELCFYTLAKTPYNNIGQVVVYLLFYHLLLFMFVWAYAKTIFTTGGYVPDEFYLSKADLEKLEAEDRTDRKDEILKQIAHNLPVYTRTLGGGMRYCSICKAVKPDRCHHCSVCERCILKMDHHCPWVNNCVGFTNYKYFVLFLFYALVYCLYVAATVLPYFIKFWSEVGATGINFQVMFVFIVAVVFALSVVTLLIYHIQLSGLNRSTLESFRAPVFRHGPDKEGFSRGSFCNNFREIFGEEKKYWPLPIFTSKGDGIRYPIQARDEDSDRLLDEPMDDEAACVESEMTSGEESRGPGKGNNLHASIQESINYSTITESDKAPLTEAAQPSGTVNYAIENETK